MPRTEPKLRDIVTIPDTSEDDYGFAVQADAAAAAWGAVYQYHLSSSDLTQEIGPVAVAWDCFSPTEAVAQSNSASPKRGHMRNMEIRTVTGDDGSKASPDSSRNRDEYGQMASSLRSLSAAPASTFTAPLTESNLLMNDSYNVLKDSIDSSLTEQWLKDHKKLGCLPPAKTGNHQARTKDVQRLEHPKLSDDKVRNVQKLNDRNDEGAAKCFVFTEKGIADAKKLGYFDSLGQPSVGSRVSPDQVSVMASQGISKKQLMETGRISRHPSASASVFGTRTPSQLIGGSCVQVPSALPISTAGVWQPLIPAPPINGAGVGHHTSPTLPSDGLGAGAQASSPLAIGVLQMSSDVFEPTAPALGSQIVRYLGCSPNSSIQKLTANFGGCNCGVWLLIDGRAKFVLKLVRSQRHHRLYPTDAEKCAELASRFPQMLNDPLMSFPIMILKCLGAGGKDCYDLLVMREAPGYRLSDIIAHRFNTGQSDRIPDLLRQTGNFLSRFQASYGLQHGDFNPSNVFYEEASGRFTAIDVSNMGVAPYADKDDFGHFNAALMGWHESYGAQLMTLCSAAFAAGYRDARRGTGGTRFPHVSFGPDHP